MNEHDTQHDRVLAMLEIEEAVCSTTFLRHRMPRAGARICELRQEGHLIETRRCSRPGHSHRTRQIEYALAREAQQGKLPLEVN